MDQMGGLGSLGRSRSSVSCAWGGIVGVGKDLENIGISFGDSFGEALWDGFWEC